MRVSPEKSLTMQPTARSPIGVRAAAVPAVTPSRRIRPRLERAGARSRSTVASGPSDGRVPRQSVWRHQVGPADMYHLLRSGRCHGRMDALQEPASACQMPPPENFRSGYLLREWCLGRPAHLLQILDVLCRALHSPPPCILLADASDWGGNTNRQWRRRAPLRR
jgi:hypothetical protein